MKYLILPFVLLAFNVNAASCYLDIGVTHLPNITVVTQLEIRTPGYPTTTLTATETFDVDENFPFLRVGCEQNNFHAEISELGDIGDDGSILYYAFYYRTRWEF